MVKNQKQTKENLLESTPESSEAEEVVVSHKKAAKDAPSKPQHKAPEVAAKPAKDDGKKKSEKPQKEVPRKESGHSNKDEVPKAPIAKAAEEKAHKKDKSAKKEEVAAPKKKEGKEEAKLGKRDAPSKPVHAPKKEERVREISSDSSEDSEEEERPKAPPKKEEKKAAKKEEKPHKKEEKVVPAAKKSESSAPESKKASFHEEADKNKKVKPSAPAAAPKKEADSKVNKMKQALKKPETSESEEMEVEEDSESMEVEEEAPKARKASADKTAPRKASAEKQAAPRKASADKTPAPRKASADKVQPAQQHQNGHQAQARPAFNRDNNAGNNRYGPQYEVIVFGLPFQSSEQDIRAHFGDIQDIINVKVMMGQDGRPRGKAFLKFGSEQSMNDALALNGSNLGGRNISVELTDNMKGQQGGQQGGFQGGQQGGFQGGNRQNFQPRQNFQAGPPEHLPENTNVMVKNLAFSVDEGKLQNVFAGCGPIKQVRVCKKEDGSSRGFGFIDFTSIDSARNALKKSGEKIDGRNIEVNYSRPRDPSAPRQGGFGGRPGGFGGRPGGFGAEKKGALTQFTGEAVELD